MATLNGNSVSTICVKDIEITTFRTEQDMSILINNRSTANTF